MLDSSQCELPRQTPTPVSPSRKCSPRPTSPIENPQRVAVDGEQKDPKDSSVVSKSPFENGLTRPKKIKLLRPKIVQQDSDFQSHGAITRLRRLSYVIRSAGRRNVNKVEEDISKDTPRERKSSGDPSQTKKGSPTPEKSLETPTDPKTSPNSKQPEGSKLSDVLERLPESVINSRGLVAENAEKFVSGDGTSSENAKSPEGRSCNSPEKTESNSNLKEGPKTDEVPTTESQIILSASDSDGPSDNIESTDSGCDSQKVPSTERLPDKLCGITSCGFDLPQIDDPLRSKEKDDSEAKHSSNSLLYCLTPSTSESDETPSYRSICASEEISDFSLSYDMNETFKDLSDGSVHADNPNAGEETQMSSSKCSSSFDLRSTYTSHPLSSQEASEKGPLETIHKVALCQTLTTNDVEALIKEAVNLYCFTYEPNDDAINQYNNVVSGLQPVQEHSVISRNDQQKSGSSKDSVQNPETPNHSAKSRRYSLSSIGPYSCKNKKLRRQKKDFEILESRRSLRGTRSSGSDSSDSDVVQRTSTAKIRSTSMCVSTSSKDFQEPMKKNESNQLELQRNCQDQEAQQIEPSGNVTSKASKELSTPSENSRVEPVQKKRKAEDLLRTSDSSDSVVITMPRSKKASLPSKFPHKVSSKLEKSIHNPSSGTPEKNPIEESGRVGSNQQPEGLETTAVRDKNLDDLIKVRYQIGI